MDFFKNSKWRRPYIPCMQTILAKHLTQNDVWPELVTKTKEATVGFMVFKKAQIRAAAHIRSPEWLEDHGHEFTMRYRTAGGGDTEVDKTYQGAYHFLLYCHADDNENHPCVCAYALIDLKLLCASYSKKELIYLGESKKNRDGPRASSFLVLPFKCFPPKMIVAAEGLEHHLNPKAVSGGFDMGDIRPITWKEAQIKSRRRIGFDTTNGQAKKTKRRKHPCE